MVFAGAGVSAGRAGEQAETKRRISKRKRDVLFLTRMVTILPLPSLCNRNPPAENNRRMKFQEERFIPRPGLFYPSNFFFKAASAASYPATICFFIMSSMPGMEGIPAGINTASVCMVTFVPLPSGSRM